MVAVIIIVIILAIAFLLGKNADKSKDNSNSKTSTNYKDYPAMKIIVTILNVLTALVILAGVIQIFILMDSMNGMNENFSSMLIILQILGTAFAATLLKFFAESIKILCDIAFYLKSINEKTK